MRTPIHLVLIFALSLIAGASIARADDGDACTADMESVRKACKTQDMDEGFSDEDKETAKALLAQEQKRAAEAGNVKGSAEASRGAADSNKAVATLSGMKAAACEKTGDKCNASCDQAERYHLQKAQFYSAAQKNDEAKKETAAAAKMNKQKKTCEQQKKEGSSASMGQMMQMLGQMAQALMAMQQASASATPSPSATPTAQDCSNPDVAKVSILCICQADPKNPMCAAKEQFAQTTTTTNGDFGPTTPAYSAADTANDGQFVTGAAGKPNSASGSSAGAGGGSGGGPSAGGGGGGGAGAGGGGDDGSGRSNVDKNVITGQSGGSGGAGGGGFSGGSGGGGGGGRGGGGSGSSNGGSFDLSKFLPKSKTRGLSGMSIPAKDGVTGPMGPTIWEKVSNQYQHQKSGMIGD